MRKLNFSVGGYFPQHFTYYAAYQLLVLIVHLIIVSFISFFHFLLDHRLSVIEEWAFEKSWEIAILTKVISLYFILKFILIKSESRDIKKEILPKKAFSNIPMSFYVSSIFLFLLLLWLGNPSFSETRDFSIFNFLISWIGTIIFYCSDLLVLYSLKNYYPLKGGNRALSFLVIPTVFYYCGKIIFIYNSNITFFVVFSMFILMLVSELEKRQFVYPLLLTTFVIAPFAAIFGIDPLWGNSNSFLVMKHSYSVINLVIVSLIFVGYLLAKHMGIKNMFRFFYFGIINFFKSFRLKRS